MHVTVRAAAMAPLAALVLAALPGVARAQRVSPPAGQAPLPPLYQAITAQRARAGLPALATSPELEQLASVWARHIAARGDLIHRNDLRRIMSDRGWWSLTENLHFSTRPFDPAEVMASWMASRNHRKNLLDPDVTHIGLGTATDAGGHAFTVFNAARLNPPPPDPTGEPMAGLIAPPGSLKPSPIPKR